MLLKCKYNKYKSIYFHSKESAHCNYEHFHCRKDKQMVDVFPKFLVSLKRPTFFSDSWSMLKRQHLECFFSSYIFEHFYSDIFKGQSVKRREKHTAYIPYLYIHFPVYTANIKAT